MGTRRDTLATLGGMLCLAALPAARGQEAAFPSRLIRIVAPFPPGGATDLTARLMAEGFRKFFGQQVLVENRPGASGIVGADYVARAEPDGTTLLLGSMSLHAILPSLDKRMGEAQKNLTPIGLIGTTPSYVVVPASLPVNTIQELVAYVKASPGKYPYGSAGSAASQHIFAESFTRAAGMQMFHVPYKGSGALMTDLIAGRVIMAVEGPAAMPHIKAGTIKALAVASLKRTAVHPEVPTVHETVVPNFEGSIWLSIYGPAGIPAPIVQRLNAAMAATLADPDIRPRLEGVGIVVETSTPEALAERNRRDAAKYAELIRVANIRLE